MNIADLDRATTAASDLLKALASPSRLRILCQLCDGEKSVGQIAAAVGLRETSGPRDFSPCRWRKRPLQNSGVTVKVPQ